MYSCHGNVTKSKAYNYYHLSAYGKSHAAHGGVFRLWGYVYENSTYPLDPTVGLGYIGLGNFLNRS